MNSDDITQIKISKHKVGIMGLTEVFEALVDKRQSMTDEEIKTSLLERVGKKNYISGNAKLKYEKALFTEFKKFVGEPIDNEKTDDIIEIKILGQGCTQCNQLEQDVINIVSGMNIDADIEHVTDIKEIGKYGVMGMPALVINGSIKSVGSIPLKTKIMAWIDEAK